MNSKCFKVLLFTVLISQCAALSSQQPKNDNTKKRQIILFDGKSTDVWKDIKSEKFPEQGWVVKEGVLTVMAKTDS